MEENKCYNFCNICNKKFNDDDKSFPIYDEKSNRIVGIQCESCHNLEFSEFPKMARLSREVIITEKIDGTNAQILITKDNRLLTGSRTRWITPNDDNYGFAKWVEENREEVLKLGIGRHFGEWWGSGIQRGYNLPKGEKRFSLFNVSRWALFGTEPQIIPSADPRIVK
jgi:hypothetical protein